jgi:hypothetical protein
MNAITPRKQHSLPLREPAFANQSSEAIQKTLRHMALIGNNDLIF